MNKDLAVQMMKVILGDDEKLEKLAKIIISNSKVPETGAPVDPEDTHDVMEHVMNRLGNIPALIDHLESQLEIAVTEGDKAKYQNTRLKAFYENVIRERKKISNSDYIYQLAQKCELPIKLQDLQ